MQHAPSGALIYEDNDEIFENSVLFGINRVGRARMESWRVGPGDRRDCQAFARSKHYGSCNEKQLGENNGRE